MASKISMIEKVTIVTVVYNRIQVIEKTILSVLALKSSMEVEYLVIDGASTDGTLEIVEKYGENLTVVSERDNGIYDAMNKAIQKATGKWIIFMNAGDVFYSSDALKILEGNEADVVYGDAIIQYPTFTTAWKKLDIKDFWKGLPFCHQASFVKTSLMKTHLFSLRYKLSSDFDFFYKLYKSGGSFMYVPLVICVYDFTTGASVLHNFVSLNERKKSVLNQGFSFHKWGYYLFVTLYARIAFLFKNIFGKRITGWVTQFLRR